MSQARQCFSAWTSPHSDHMAFLQLEQKNSLPYFTPLKSMPTPNVESSFRLSTTETRCLRDSHFALPNELGVSDKKINASCAPAKRFLIFDQSGSQTRLFFSPSFSSQNQNIASKTPPNNVLVEKVTSQADEQFLVKQEKWDENDLIDEEGEMVEDSEEINALLYSDSDDEYDDGENDEVTSPVNIKAGYDRDKLPEEIMEDVASCDSSPKRQRLLDGRYNKKPSLITIESPVNSCSYDKDVGSSYANSYDDDTRKVKIRQALKILGSIIPGLRSNDPLSIIDQGIVYLESLKIEAETLGFTPNSYQETI